MLMDIVLPLAGGLVLLALGGELLVRGAVQAAERLGVSPLLIGLTLVGFGTSTPELVTSVQAALIGSPGIAVGNIVGSNIANILLILGVSALIFPVAVASSALKRDGMLVAATAAAMVGVGLFWSLDRLVGVAFVAGLVGYLVFAYRQEMVTAKGGEHTAAYERAEAFEELHEPVLNPPQERLRKRDLALPILLALAGLVLVVLGGRFFVNGAVTMARGFGISETVIGLTIVAVGTSLPELITSVIAALRKHADVALGNILGSNIYNILGIGGLTALIAPTPVPAEIARFDAPLMLAASVLLLALARTGWRIGRREGALLVAGYVAYVWWIWPTT
jgi:cation:H+ antiporter